MLNKKGFTIAEVLVSFILITIVLSSVITATVFYHDRLKREEVISQLVDFKNTITKIVHDDIIDPSKDIVRVDTCVGTINCVNFITSSNTSHTLKIVDQPETANGKRRGVYMHYDGVEYFLPDSDLGTSGGRVCDFINGLEVETYQNKIYRVKATFKHKDYDDLPPFELLFVIS